MFNFFQKKQKTVEKINLEEEINEIFQKLENILQRDKANLSHYEYLLLQSNVYQCFLDIIDSDSDKRFLKTVLNESKSKYPLLYDLVSNHNE